jgi:hypothetical protein
MRRILFPVLFAALGLGACSSDYTQEEIITGENKKDRLNRGMGKFLGENTLTFGGAKKRSSDTSNLGINTYLWRASLDTISFMPLASADPFGGVIMTEWYSPPESPQERFKINILILDRQLRSDGLKISIFREGKDPVGQWKTLSVDSQMVTDLENAILARARHFRSLAIK